MPELVANKLYDFPSEEDNQIRLPVAREPLRLTVHPQNDLTPGPPANLPDAPEQAHVRMNDRIIEGKKSLHLEEIQSDWHQQGREKGYANDKQEPQFTVIDQNGNQRGSFKSKEEAQNYLNNAPEFIDKNKSKILQVENKVEEGVPNAPFKKTWHELVLKRMIREAAESGKDRLSWTPGEAQAERYDLSKQVEQISFNPDNGKLKAYTKGGNGEKVIDKTIKSDELANYIGKEAANKIMKEPTRTYDQIDGKYHILEGEGLKVGGEGMKGFYDQIIPKALEKIGKEYGVKVKSDKLTSGTNQDFSLINKYGHMSKGGATRAEAEKSLKEKNEYFGGKDDEWKVIDNRKKVHYIDIPKGLKDAALHKGFPLFSNSHPGMMFTPTSDNPFEDKKK
jgi:hypothetical protein